ncbi:MAG: FAD-binding protein, partial [Blautia hydrogenotrophica]
MKIELRGSILKEEIKNEFCRILGSDHVLVEEPMSAHTTFRIGGPAEYYVCPHSVDELQRTLDVCRRYQLPYFILGNGSNLLVSDQGYRGVIIQLFRNMSQIDVQDEL